MRPQLPKQCKLRPDNTPQSYGIDSRAAIYGFKKRLGYTCIKRRAPDGSTKCSGVDELNGERLTVGQSVWGIRDLNGERLTVGQSVWGIHQLNGGRLSALLKLHTEYFDIL